MFSPWLTPVRRCSPVVGHAVSEAPLRRGFAAPCEMFDLGPRETLRPFHTSERPFASGIKPPAEFCCYSVQCDCCVSPRIQTCCWVWLKPEGVRNKHNTTHAQTHTHPHRTGGHSSPLPLWPKPAQTPHATGGWSDSPAEQTGFHHHHNNNNNLIHRHWNILTWTRKTKKKSVNRCHLADKHRDCTIICWGATLTHASKHPKMSFVHILKTSSIWYVLFNIHILFNCIKLRGTQQDKIYQNII